jgi:hypothetical protein
MNKHFIFETQRLLVITFGVNPRQANIQPAGGQHNRQAQRAHESGFGGFHEPEEIREMHDPGHIGVREFNAPGQLKFAGHVQAQAQEAVAFRNNGAP